MRGMALEKYPEDSKQRKEMATITHCGNSTAKDFDNYAEEQIWRKWYMEQPILEFQLEKLGEVISKLEKMYPSTILKLAKLKDDAKDIIDDLKSEVYDLEQIVQEATGFWYIDPKHCNCDKILKYCSSGCNACYEKIMKEDRLFCFEMFIGLRSHCSETIEELNAKLILELSRMHSELRDGYCNQNGTQHNK